MRGILIYNENKVEKGEAKIILASGFAVDIDKLNLDQKIQRFKNLTDLNPTVKTNTMHISLNFDAADNLDLQKVQQIAHTYMEQIGFGDQPYIVYRHLDAAHPHIHIATTLMQKDGKRKYTHNMGRLVSEPARKAIETEVGLIKAEGRKQGNLLSIKPAVYGHKPTKQTINSIVLSVRQQYAFTSLAEFNAILGQFNISADRGKEATTMFEKKGLLYSILDQKRNPIGVPIKASSFYDQPTLKNLEKDFQAGMDKRKPFKENLKKRIDWVMQKYNTLTINTLINEMARQQVGVIFRQNNKGMIYGLTFVDHKLKTVFNGSDLGKDYSARAITENFAAQDQIRTYLKPNQATTFLGNPLEPLLEKADFDAPTVIGKKKKRKKANQQNL